MGENLTIKIVLLFSLDKITQLTLCFYLR